MGVLKVHAIRHIAIYKTWLEHKPEGAWKYTQHLELQAENINRNLTQHIRDLIEDSEKLKAHFDVDTGAPIYILNISDGNKTQKVTIVGYYLMQVARADYRIISCELSSLLDDLLEEHGVEPAHTEARKASQLGSLSTKPT